jgi:hypothetical protein
VGQRESVMKDPVREAAFAALGAAQAAAEAMKVRAEELGLFAMMAK